MRSHILSRFNFADQVRCVTANAFSGDFDSLDDALWVNNEGTAIRQTFVFAHDFEVTGQCASWVADHRVFDFCDGFGRTVPGFVGKVRVGRNRVDVYAQFLQFFVMVCHVTQLSWANEGEVSRVEEEYTPFTFNVFLGYVDEFAVFERCVFEWFDFGINDGHGDLR